VTVRILIVDDAPGNILLQKTCLADSAHEIRGVTDSYQVELVFAEFDPDIVLLDLQMPDPDTLAESKAVSDR
jgi:CheY-like chemotaxis protein